MSSPKGFSGIGRGCAGGWLSRRPWRYLNDMWMWHLETRFSGGFGSVGLMVGLSHRDLFQSNPMFNSVLILRVQIMRLNHV